jgi:hypothetical protein
MDDWQSMTIADCGACGLSSKADEGYTEVRPRRVQINVIAVVCGRCGCRGPESDTPAGAIAAWNKMWAPKESGEPTAGALPKITVVTVEINYGDDTYAVYRDGVFLSDCDGYKVVNVLEALGYDVEEVEASTDWVESTKERRGGTAPRMPERLEDVVLGKCLRGVPGCQ